MASQGSLGLQFESARRQRMLWQYAVQAVCSCEQVHTGMDTAMGMPKVAPTSTTVPSSIAILLMTLSFSLSARAGLSVRTPYN